MNLSALYRRHGSALFRFALHLTGQRATAEDLVADTFVVAVAGGGRAEPTSAQAFLFGTLRHLALHGRRAAARRPAAPAGALELLPDPADPERDAVARLELAATLSDLQTLPEESRAAVLLRAEGLGYQAIAQVLRVSEGAAKVRVHRARVLLAARRAHREGAAP